MGFVHIFPTCLHKTILMGVFSQGLRITWSPYHSMMQAMTLVPAHGRNIPAGCWWEVSNKAQGLVESAMNCSSPHTYRNYWRNCCKLQLSPLWRCNLVQMECLPGYSHTNQRQRTLLKEAQAELRPWHHCVSAGADWQGFSWAVDCITAGTAGITVSDWLERNHTAE